MKIAIMGFGGRGNVYAHFTKYFGEEVVAVCDPDETKRNSAYEYGVSEDMFFTDEESFFNRGKIADALVISTMDTLHYRQTMRALEIGYNILLEKPIAVTREECEAIEKKAKETGRKIVICHVLRYSPFYKKIKEIIDGGELGNVVSLALTENIGYYHFAHSFVRGNWRNEKVSTPLILQKNCHDLDLICWLLGRNCVSVSSYGGLNYFKKENAPDGSASHCVYCQYKDTCAYSCFRIYENIEYEKIAGLAAHGRLGRTNKEIEESLSNMNNLYSRCVFKCDNDVCDHQMVNMLFEGGITVSLNSVAFTENLKRHINVYCERGNIRDNGNGNLIVEKFGEEQKEIIIEYPKGGYAHHSGGDVGIVKEFIDYVKNGKMTKTITDITVSMLGHKIGFLAEESRKNGGQLCELK